MVGEEGRGVPTIIEMVNHTRLDCVIGAATGYARRRRRRRSTTPPTAPPSARTLIDQPLMRNVLADLCVESEAATVAAMRLARAYDEVAAGDERGAPSSAASPTPSLKYWICKRAPSHAVECLECLGGNGYVEESGMPRLYREARWPRSGRARATSSASTCCGRWSRARPRSRPSSPRCWRAPAPSPRLDAYVAALRDEIPGDIETIEPRARRVVEKMALALQASLLVRYGDPAVADAFCASRLAGDWGHAFGTLPAGTDFSAHHRAPPAR